MWKVLIYSFHIFTQQEQSVGCVEGSEWNLWWMPHGGSCSLCRQCPGFWQVGTLLRTKLQSPPWRVWESLSSQLVRRHLPHSYREEFLVEEKHQLPRGVGLHRKPTPLILQYTRPGSRPRGQKLKTDTQGQLFKNKRLYFYTYCSEKWGEHWKGWCHSIEPCGALEVQPCVCLAHWSKRELGCSLWETLHPCKTAASQSSAKGSECRFTLHKKEISPSTGPREERSPKNFVKASSLWCLGIIPQAWIIPSLPHQECQLSSISPDKRSPTGLAGDVKFLRNVSA